MDQSNKVVSIGYKNGTLVRPSLPNVGCHPMCGRTEHVAWKAKQGWLSKGQLRYLVEESRD
jgi:hypothetical protein